ncbi:hypothetical protein BIW11_10729 [Tropilaelaps mercedesae]|uniref:Uncharacterized protein n=1 Tax=Tropilaelaps mercedesae TaxID=418985 RepID=A0A1V9XEA2_9ACAR|nr:hypothetical protein BIW11_10729 [Tropilaelaps mercedesae]
MASGHPHNNYINNGGLLPIPQISIEAIVHKVAGWFGRTPEDSERPFHQHPMDGSPILIRACSANSAERRWRLRDALISPINRYILIPIWVASHFGDDNGDDEPPEGSEEEPGDPEDDADDPDDPKKENNGSNEGDGDDGDEDGAGRHGEGRGREYQHPGGKSNSGNAHNPPFGGVAGVTTSRPHHGYNNNHNANGGHEHPEHAGGQNNPWRPRTTKASPIDEIRKINNEDGWKSPGRPFPPVRQYPAHGRDFHESTSSSTSTTPTPLTTDGYGGGGGLRNRSSSTAAMRELWCHVYANAGLRDDQLRTLSEHCNYLLIDGEVHLQGMGLMPKVMSDAQILNRIRGAMPSSVKILLATKDFDSGFDKLLEVDDAEPSMSGAAGGEGELRARGSAGLTPGGGPSPGTISPKRAQAFDAVIGLLKRYQVQGLALRELEGAKHYNLNQADKGERAQLRARWAALYVQLAEYLAEKGFEHAFLVKPSLERYREYSLRNIVNEGLGPVLLTSGALRAATSTLCVSPFKWMRDKRVITQTKVSLCRHFAYAISLKTRSCFYRRSLHGGHFVGDTHH